MAMRISALQPSGETMILEVTPEMTGHELKQQIKEGQPWDDLTRKTTRVEIIVGDHLLANDAKVWDTGVDADTVSVIFKVNMVVCSNQSQMASSGSEIDLELPLVVELPDHETKIAERAFDSCERLAKLIIPRSVTHIGFGAFVHCSILAGVTIPDSVTHIGNSAFEGCSSLGELDHPGLDDPHRAWSLSELQLFGAFDHPQLRAFFWFWCLSALQLFDCLDHPRLTNPRGELCLFELQFLV